MALLKQLSWTIPTRRVRGLNFFQKYGRQQITHIQQMSSNPSLADLAGLQLPETTRSYNFRDVILYALGVRGLNFFQKYGRQQITHIQQMSSNPSLADLAGLQLPETTRSYNFRDVILYALGVGVTTSHSNHLQFLYEKDPKFSVLPTYATTFTSGWLDTITEKDSVKLPISFDMSKIFHGEQYLELIKPLSVAETLVHKTTITDVLDKGKGSILVLEVDSYTTDGTKVAHNQSTIYTTEFSKWGGKRNSDRVIKTANPPDRPPDASITEITSTNQAALYRLNGDFNPFHIDPVVANKGGFPNPILHGLCSLGFSARHIIEQFCDNDVSKFKSLKVRFSRPVIPGDSLQTDMWKENSRIHFQTKNVKENAVCISGAYMDIHD